MGCGGSKGATIEIKSERPPAQEATNRSKTPSVSSSSEISSYRQSQLLQQAEGPGSEGPQDFSRQNKAESASDEEVDEMIEQLYLATDHQKREAEAEEERRRQEQARAEEEERRRQQQLQAEESRRQEEASRQAEGQREVLLLSQQTQMTQVSGEGRCFTHREIFQHNAKVGWVEWIPHKGKVYDGNGFRTHFPAYMNNRPAMMEARARQRVAEGGEEKETEFVTFVSPIVCSSFIFPEYSEMLSIRNPQVWEHNGIVVLRFNGISEEELAKELPPFLLGTITDTSGSAYLDSFREDVAMLLEDLQGQSDDTKSPALQDYTALLSRWQNKYRVVDSLNQSTVSDGTDPNERCYPLPVDPESLRVYVLEWEPFDLEIPPEGAWQSYELENIDLGDPHEIFCSSLRVNFDIEDLVFDIEGEVAWELLLDNAIKDELMTPKQQEIQAARDKRTDLNDLERMKKRREELCDYFIETRELPPAVVMPFLQWASLLEASQEQLDKLC